MIVSYDIDGVLAAQPPANDKKWGHMNGAERKARQKFLYNWYMAAERLLEPTETTFFAISARKNNPLVYDITKNWLEKHYSNRVKRCFLLDTSRTVENVVKFKSQIVLSNNIQRHYEDNKTVLKGMRKLLPPEIELYFWERGMAEPVPFEGKK